MIPFASQRGNGQDLAAHLMNAHDNETVALAQVRGAVARDLAGAFAEWEAQAAALTRCRNYLYSLSVNPDPQHGRLSREQYLAYLEAVEDALGLKGQPRAVVFHVKDGREHCHAVWSRVDAAQGRTVHLAYDHEKLMAVTRRFADAHGITLPPGYYTDERGEQLSLYEKVQQDETGLRLEERKTVVTGLWQRSDSPAAFVSALAEHGYILATGKRPFVLVDLYGHVNALPRLIDDRQVRTKDLRAFFGDACGPDTLPGVEEAQALAAQHRKALEDFEAARAGPDPEAETDEQTRRETALASQAAEQKERQRAELQALADRHKAERAAHRTAFHAETRRLRIERAQRRPRGLAAFLARVTGLALIRRKRERREDRKRYEAFRAAKARLRQQQAEERATLLLRHELQAMELARQARALARTQQRERQSRETARTRDRRKRLNARHPHMPPIGAVATTRGEQSPPADDRRQPRRRAIGRTPRLAERLDAAARLQEDRTLTTTFSEAGAGDQGESRSGDGGSAGGAAPLPEAGKTKRDRCRERPRRQGRATSGKGPLRDAFERAGEDESGENSDGDTGSTGGARPASKTRRAQRPRRERKRKRKAHDHDQERDQAEAPLHKRRPGAPDPDRGR